MAYGTMPATNSNARQRIHCQQRISADLADIAATAELGTHARASQQRATTDTDTAEQGIAAAKATIRVGSWECTFNGGRSLDGSSRVEQRARQPVELIRRQADCVRTEREIPHESEHRQSALTASARACTSEEQHRQSQSASTTRTGGDAAIVGLRTEEVLGRDAVPRARNADALDRRAVRQQRIEHTTEA